MRIYPEIVELWVACFSCEATMPLGSWHVHDLVLGPRTKDGIEIEAIGADTVLPMDQGLANALGVAVEAFAPSHDAHRSSVRLVAACPDGFEVLSEPDPTLIDASGAKALVIDPDRGADAEARVAFAIHRMTRDPAARAQQLEDLACLGFARETLAGNRAAKRYVGWLREDSKPEIMHARAVDVTLERGLVSDALELMRRFFVKPDAVPDIVESVSEALADSSLPPQERERVFRFARGMIPEAIDAAYRQGRLPAASLPDTWEQHASHPLGRELLCLSVRLAHIKEALVGSDDTRAGIALKVLQDLVRIQPEVAGAAEPWLRGLLTDERRLPRGGVMATIAVPLYRAALAALENKKVRELLPFALQQSLAVFDHLSLGFWSYYKEARRLHVRKSTILKLLLEVLGDPKIPVRTRVRARRVLDRGPAEQAVVEAKRRADEIVLEILRDPDESEQIREAMYEQLRKWMPNRIPELRGNLIERVSAMPALADLRSEHGYKLGAKLQELSTQVEVAQVVRLIAKGRKNKRGQIETALAIVPHLTSWREDVAAELEPAVRARLLDRNWPEAGRVAAIYSKLLYDIAESGSGMPDVDDVLADISRIAPEALDRNAWCDLLDRLREVYAEDRVPSWLTFRATAPETAPDVRFAAFNALCRRSELSPELRVGIGVSAVNAESDAEERHQILGLLCDTHPEDAVEAARKGKMSATGLPAITWLYKLRDDTANPLPGRLEVASHLVPAAEIIEALGARNRVDRTLAALELLPAVLDADKTMRGRAAEALLPLVSDTRSLGTSHRFEVMPNALEQYLDVVGGDAARVERALLATLDSPKTARFAVRCFRPQMRGSWTQMIGTLFDAAAGHRESPARRLAAWIALFEAGSSDHETADKLGAAAARATPAIRGLLQEPETPSEVVHEARQHPRAKQLL